MLPADGLGEERQPARLRSKERGACHAPYLLVDDRSVIRDGKNLELFDVSYFMRNAV